MSATKIGAAVFDLLLLLVGPLGSAVSMLAFIDPVWERVADDNDPFGVPPSRLSSLLIHLMFLCVGALGILLAWRSIGGRRQSL